MIEKKIYSAVDATEELVGTWGYFADTVAEIKKLAEKNCLENIYHLVGVGDERKKHRFQQTASNYAPFSLYFPVCTEENKEAYIAWCNGYPVTEVHSNVSYTYVREGGAEPDFLNDTLVTQKKEKLVEREYTPFGTIDEFIDASGVTNKNCAGKGSRPFIWLRLMDTEVYNLVTGYSNHTNSVIIDGHTYDMVDLFRNWTFLDESPCGKLIV